MKLRQFITKLYRFICIALCVLFCATTMLAAGCIIQLGDGSASSGSSSGTGTGGSMPTASVLPDPDNAPSPSSNLTPEQQARRDEADRYAIHRPMYWKYVLGETGATSIQDYLANDQDAGQSGPEPPANRLYVGLIADAPNRGVTGIMNQFAPLVEKDSFSVMEFAVYCQGAPGASVQEELIGIVLSVDKRNFAYLDPKDYDALRLHVESYRTVDGVQHGGWDQNAPGFKLHPYNTQYPVGNAVPASTPGNPVGHWPAIVQSLTNDWWVSYNGWFLGYFDASQFTLLDKGGCWAEWYLEVLDRKAGTAWVETHMGTGKFGDTAASGEAAWVQMPMYWDTNYVLQEPQVDQGMKPVNYACYKRSQLMDLGPGLGKIFLAGGPGGYNPLCTK